MYIWEISVHLYKKQKLIIIKTLLLKTTKQINSRPQHTGMHSMTLNNGNIFFAIKNKTDIHYSFK